MLFFARSPILSCVSAAYLGNAELKALEGGDETVRESLCLSWLISFLWPLCLISSVLIQSIRSSLRDLSDHWLFGRGVWSTKDPVPV